MQGVFEIMDLNEMRVEIFTFKCGATVHHATTMSGIGMSQEVLNRIVVEVKRLCPGNISNPYMFLFMFMYIYFL